MSAKRNLGFGCLGLVLVVGVAVGFIFVQSQQRLTRTFDEVRGVDLAVPSDSAAIARGRYLGEAVLACTECHGRDLGGTMFIDAAPMGKLAAPNLTRGRGGVGNRFTGRDWDRAIRHGVGSEGQGLLIMPAESYTHLTDGELGDLVAYLTSLPPVDREFPPRSLGPITRMLLATGRPIQPAAYVDHGVARREAAPEGATVERGAHLVEISGCRACHGQDLTGGKIPGADPSWPPAANLTPHAEGLGRHTFESFDRVLRTGKKPDGSAIDPSTMPWTSYAQMEKGETEAIWAYLRTVEARARAK